MCCYVQFAQAVDYYLTEGKQYIPEIHKLALQSSSKDTDARLLGYAMEGIRLSGLGACREAAMSDIIREDDGRRVQVQSGSRVFVSFVGCPPPFLICRLFPFCYDMNANLCIPPPHPRPLKLQMQLASPPRLPSTQLAPWNPISIQASVLTPA